MKKILFLLLICFIKLNAYEYVITKNNDPIKGIYRFYYDDSTGLLKEKYYNNGTLYEDTSNQIVFINQLGYIKSNSIHFIDVSQFTSYLKLDEKFLSDFYTQQLNAILNYFYNKNNFSGTNYIQYENYEILYNDDGFAVESIVNGVWAGLYDDSQKIRSGALYDKNGSLVYYNGKEVTPVTSFLVWLQKFTNRVVIETFEEIQRSFISGIIAAVVLVLAIVRLVLELLPSSITPRRRRYYGGVRGSLPDFGDGRQVSASVRARLAAKNQALKARAYDRSGVEESTVNGILFDLENDR